MNLEVNLNQSSETHWVSSTDLMSGLMIVFLFISIAFMIQTSKEKENIEKVSQDWAKTKEKINEALEQKFERKLNSWNAEIDEEALAIRFKEPSILFEPGSKRLTPKFKKILDEFFPEYLRTLQPFSENIAEIRVEGHSSSEWNGVVKGDEAYFANMHLSQDRSTEVLLYSLFQIQEDSIKNFGKTKLIAAGMSSSKLVFLDGKEDAKASRRVEFRVRTNSDERLAEIVNKSNSKEEAAQTIYYIIGSSWENSDKACKEMNAKKNEYHRSCILSEEIEDKLWYRVALYYTCSESDARRKVAEIKEFEGDAWVLKKPI